MRKNNTCFAFSKLVISVFTSTIIIWPFTIHTIVNNIVGVWGSIIITIYNISYPSFSMKYVYSYGVSFQMLKSKFNFLFGKQPVWIISNSSFQMKLTAMYVMFL